MFTLQYIFVTLAVSFSEYTHKGEYMPQRKVVFVGTEDKLYAFTAFYKIFEEEGWQVERCESIEKAMNIQHIDVLIVWAFLDLYVKEYEAWKNRPKTIWYTFISSDKVPRNVKVLRAIKAPTELYKTALSLCK